MVVPNDLKLEYPFAQNELKLSCGHKMNYVDQGEGHPIVMVHGNPTWSFYYRNLIKYFSKTNRVIVPDHIGMGLSEKPLDYDYTLDNHIENITELLEHLEIKGATFIVHDWGGAIGFGASTRRPEFMKHIIALNTAAFTSSEIPFRISLCKLPVFGEFIVRAFNAFAWPATFMTTKRKLTALEKKGYLLPHRDYNSRIAVAQFVKDIPLSAKHKSYHSLKSIEDSLGSIDDKNVMLIWGERDFCFTTKFRDRFLSFFPKAKSISFKDAGHYVIEDKLEEVVKLIGDEISEHC